MTFVCPIIYADDHPPQTGPIFFNLPSFVIPVIQNRTLQQVYSVDIILEMASTDNLQHAHKISPKLIDGIFTDLYGMLCIVWSPTVNIHLIDLKGRIFKISNGILGKDFVKSVLIQDFKTHIAR